MLSDVKEIRQEFLTGERALFGKSGLKIYDTIFADGESPLKECKNIELIGSMLKWKYPLWYSTDVIVKNCTWFEMACAGIWYTNKITVEDSLIEAPKNFRRYSELTLKNISFPNAAETLWCCKDVVMEKVTATGDYFAMNSENISMCDSFVSGEYLGWNAKNLTLINCVIESLQGMCYIDNLVMKNCKLINTTLAFEYSTIEVDIVGRIDSVLNPSSGTIRVDFIKELTIEKDKC